MENTYGIYSIFNLVTIYNWNPFIASSNPIVWQSNIILNISVGPLSWNVYLKLSGVPSTSRKVNGEDLYNKIKEEPLALTFLPERHVKGFAVPISKNNKVIAALSIFLPAYRCNETKQLEVIAMLKEASYEIELGLKEN